MVSGLEEFMKWVRVLTTFCLDKKVRVREVGQGQMCRGFHKTFDVVKFEVTFQFWL